jgi:ribosomal protein L31E
VRVDPQLNKKVWEGGIKSVPHRMRLRLSRKRNDEEGAIEKLYTYVEAVNVKDVKGLQTVVVES